MRIMIVEDEMLIALVAEDDLRGAGHDVVGIASGYAQAVELAEAEHPDLVVMDVRLASDRDGIDTATTLRHRLDIPSILASGSMDSRNVARAVSASPLEWLLKPYTTAQLLAAVARAARTLRPPAESAERPGGTA